MRIGIIGAGMIGETLARRLVQLGHDVALANSRGPETLRQPWPYTHPGSAVTIGRPAAMYSSSRSSAGVRQRPTPRDELARLR